MIPRRRLLATTLPDLRREVAALLRPGVVCGLALPETRHRSLRGATIRPALAEG